MKDHIDNRFDSIENRIDRTEENINKQIDRNFMMLMTILGSVILIPGSFMLWCMRQWSNIFSKSEEVIKGHQGALDDLKQISEDDKKFANMRTESTNQLEEIFNNLNELKVATESYVDHALKLLPKKEI